MQSLRSWVRALPATKRTFMACACSCPVGSLLVLKTFFYFSALFHPIFGFLGNLITADLVLLVQILAVMGGFELAVIPFCVVVYELCDLLC